jgi:hypothetical protein
MVKNLIQIIKNQKKIKVFNLQLKLVHIIVSNNKHHQLKLDVKIIQQQQAQHHQIDVQNQVQQ